MTIRQVLRGALAATLLVVGLTACGNDEPGAGEAPGTGAPDLSDGRALADWAAVKVVTRHTTDICQYGTEELLKRFGQLGYCENDPTFKETAVTLDLVATCDASKASDKQTPPGDLYLYQVDPSITFDPDKGTESGIQVTVLQDDGIYKVNSIVVASVGNEYDEEGVISNGDCPDNQATPTSDAVPVASHP